MCGHSTVLDARHGDHGVAAVQPHAADDGQFGVGPVEALVEVVDRQTWRIQGRVHFNTAST